MQVYSTATVNKPTEIQIERDKHENNQITDEDNYFSPMETIKNTYSPAENKPSTQLTAFQFCISIY